MATVRVRRVRDVAAMLVAARGCCEHLDMINEDENEMCTNSATLRLMTVAESCPEFVARLKFVRLTWNGPGEPPLPRALFPALETIEWYREDNGFHVTVDPRVVLARVRIGVTDAGVWERMQLLPHPPLDVCVCFKKRPSESDVREIERVLGAGRLRVPSIVIDCRWDIDFNFRFVDAVAAIASIATHTLLFWCPPLPADVFRRIRMDTLKRLVFRWNDGAFVALDAQASRNACSMRVDMRKSASLPVDDVKSLVRMAHRGALAALDLGRKGSMCEKDWQRLFVAAAPALRTIDMGEVSFDSAYRIFSAVAPTYVTDVTMSLTAPSSEISADWVGLGARFASLRSLKKLTLRLRPPFDVCFDAFLDALTSRHHGVERVTVDVHDWKRPAPAPAET